MSSNQCKASTVYAVAGETCPAGTTRVATMVGCQNVKDNESFHMYGVTGSAVDGCAYAFEHRRRRYRRRRSNRSYEPFSMCKFVAASISDNGDSSDDDGTWWAIILVGAVLGLLILGGLGMKLLKGRRARAAVSVEPAADEEKSSLAVVQLRESEVVSKMSIVNINTIPPYWTNKNENAFDQMFHVSGESDSIFDDMLSATFRPKVTQDRPCPRNTCPKKPGGCPCVQPGGDPGLPVGYRACRVIRVEDSGMWNQYVRKRSLIKASRAEEMPLHPLDPPAATDEVADRSPTLFAPLDDALNEIYLWHGTSVRAALSIAANDFNIDLAGSGAGTMYGCGAYLAENSTKADEYAKDEPGGYYDSTFAILLCRTCLGKFYYTTKRNPDAQEKVTDGSHDSTLGDRMKSTGTFREFVVYDKDQIYPEYIVIYRRIGESLPNDPLKK